MQVIGFVLITFALISYAATVQSIRGLIKESREIQPGTHFRLFWWLPAWRVHRVGRPASRVRTQIVTRFSITFVLMIAGTICIGVSVLERTPSSRYNDVVWHHEFPSPDGSWLAIAETHQVGGFGSAWVGTTVSLRSLNRTVLQTEPFAVLSYPGDGSIKHAYTLSEDNADTKLAITWVDAGHLEIEYTGQTEPYLEVVKYGGLAINLRVDPKDSVE